MKIPTYEESSGADLDGTDTPLMSFVYMFTPGNPKRETVFRNRLEAVIAAARAEGLNQALEIAVGIIQNEPLGFVHGESQLIRDINMINNIRAMQPKAGQK